MNSLTNAEKTNIEDAFLCFIKKEKLLFKVKTKQHVGCIDSEIHIEYIKGEIDSYNYNDQFSKEYLWCDRVLHQFSLGGVTGDFSFKRCNFSFYFKFIRESQNILNSKESAFLLNNKMFVGSSNIIDKLIDLNNNDISVHFFNNKFLENNLNLFIENYKRFSFTHEQDKFFFDILENSDFFKKDDFRNKVYKLVKNKFTNPDFFKESFPKELNCENAELVKLKTLPSYYLEIDKKKLYDFNLMREYSSEDIDFILNTTLAKIQAFGDLFGISGYMVPEENTSNEECFLICFYGEKNKDLKIALLHNVFNKYIKHILSENTFDGVYKQIGSNVIFEKIILEESVSKTSLVHKKHKI